MNSKQISPELTQIFPNPDKNFTISSMRRKVLSPTNRTKLKPTSDTRRTSLQDWTFYLVLLKGK